LTALVFFGDMVAFFAGLAAGFFAAAGFLAEEVNCSSLT
jgi:tetrahydromethanopterin S-methyltransferase subunit F